MIYNEKILILGEHEKCFGKVTYTCAQNLMREKTLRVSDNVTRWEILELTVIQT